MYEHDANEDFGNDKSFTEMIVVSNKGPVYMIWHTIYVNLCLITPYIYASYGIFGSPEYSADDPSFVFEVIAEIFFLLNIIFTFFVDYEVDGQIMPERDLSKIAQNYLRGNFFLEALPLIPF